MGNSECLMHRMIPFTYFNTMLTSNGHTSVTAGNLPMCYHIRYLPLTLIASFLTPVYDENSHIMNNNPFYCQTAYIVKYTDALKYIIFTIIIVV